MSRLLVSVALADIPIFLAPVSTRFSSTYCSLLLYFSILKEDAELFSP